MIPLLRVIGQMKIQKLPVTKIAKRRGENNTRLPNVSICNVSISNGKKVA